MIEAFNLIWLAEITVLKKVKNIFVYPNFPFTISYSVIWVPNGKTFPVDKRDDLIDKNGIALLGESYGNAFDKFIKENLTMQRVSKVKQVFKMLEQGRGDYFPMNLAAGKI